MKHTQLCMWLQTVWHEGMDTHTKLFTCLAMPFSQVLSYLLPFGKYSTPLPWNIPSFISPTYLVFVGKVYSPLPSILKQRKNTLFYELCLSIRAHTNTRTHANTVSVALFHNNGQTTCQILLPHCNCFRYAPLTQCPAFYVGWKKHAKSI